MLIACPARRELWLSIYIAGVQIGNKTPPRGYRFATAECVKWLRSTTFDIAYPTSTGGIGVMCTCEVSFYPGELKMSERDFVRE